MKSSDASFGTLAPTDELNRELLARVHPPGRRNPAPKACYDLVVLGAGTAGLVSAAAAAGLGAKVALIERHLMGGDCLNFGCVPSKALIAAARRVAAVDTGAQFGVHTPSPTVHFAETMEHLRRVRLELSVDDSVARFTRLGVDVFLGNARFIDKGRITVAETVLTFRRAIIATGTRPAVPSIPGLADAEYLTNETVFSLTEQPKQLAIIGAGPIGCELAQAFARLGTDVCLFETEHGVLPKDDRDAAAIVRDALVRDGVQLYCCGRNLRVLPGHGGLPWRIEADSHGLRASFDTERILVATGRVPNIDELNLAAVGVEYASHGILVDDFLQTTSSGIFAAGDVCMKERFTHAADFSARIAVQNALFALGPIGRKRASSLVIPRATYTTPELAQIGPTAEELTEKGTKFTTFTKPMAEVHRARLDGTVEGFVRVHTAQGSDRILGATLVADQAGELVSTLSLAMTAKIGLKKLAGGIAPYPTHTEVIRQMGDLYNRSRLTERAQMVLRLLLAIHRRRD
ncbi:MAG: mercuric reductase [Bdellovibrionales bacterium]|nr:mercuric reductase [Bdellovibrionales bacterium]